MEVEAVLKYPAVFLAAFVVTYVATPATSAIATYFGVVDHPASRRINPYPVPRGGGVAVFLGFHAGCAMLFLVPWLPFRSLITISWWYDFFLASSFILLLGLADDIFDLRPHVKLLGQLTAALIAFTLGIDAEQIFGVDLPFYLNFALTMFWIVAITNAFNLIDGLDGLASGLAIIAGLGITGSLLFRHLPGDALTMLALVGSCLAFLRYNFFPAKVFLGDSGSMFLGFTIAVLALSTGSKGTTAATIGVPLLAVGIPIFDTMLAVWRRSVRRFFPSLVRPNGSGYTTLFAADREHLHHRLLALGLTQKTVTLMLYVASAVLVLVGITSVVYTARAGGIFVLAFTVGSYVVVRHVAYVELFDSASVIVRGIRRLSSPLLAYVAYPILDFLLLALALFVAVALTHQAGDLTTARLTWFDLVPLWCGVPFILFHAAAIYSRVWSRARSTEFILLAVVLLLGVLVALGASLLTGPLTWRELLNRAVVFFGVANFLITGLRVAPRVLQDLLAFSPRALLPEGLQRNILLIGSNERCLLYLRRRSLNFPMAQASSRVIGLIDNDRHLHNRLVHGFRVLGGVTHLPALVNKHRVHELVIVDDLKEEDIFGILSVAEQNGLTLTEWKITEQNLGAPLDERKYETIFAGV